MAPGAPRFPAGPGASRAGAWPSPLSAQQVAAASLRLAETRIDRGMVYWLEGRPAEGGRGVLVRRRIVWEGEGEELTPPGRSVRSRVHEYGGGDYLVSGGAVFAVDEAAGDVHRLRADGWRPVTGCEPGARYADLALSPDGRWLVAVEERPAEGREPTHRLVALPLLADEAPRVVASRHDFTSSPCFSPDGGRLAYLAWDHPNLPWDGNWLYVVGWGADGPRGMAYPAAGGREASVFQPRFSPSGRLTFVSDRSGWWNLYQERGREVVPLCPRAAEFGRPQWVLGLSTYDFVDERTLLCAVTEKGSDRLMRLDLATGRLDELPLPLNALEGVRVEGRWGCFLGAGPEHPLAVCLLGLEDGRLRTVRSSQALDLEPSSIARPEAIDFPSAAGRTAHAFFYRPRHARHALAPGERPPLIVRCHGGPTSAAKPVLDLALQYWTSRGFAVVDVNYAGSSGYGRAYRELLDGAWGVADVEDCLAAARHLVREAGVDPARLAVRGSSAGGYTALRALAQDGLLRVGAAYYGIVDLEALVRETHKFEAHYLDKLVGPFPERRELYRLRSPLHAPEQLSKPVILFQGLEDRVVPPSQAEALVAALGARDVPHAYVTFPDEGHGFRRATSMQRCLEAELRFYARFFGFDAESRSGRILGA